MLKFQNDYTTLFATFEDFILLVYTVLNVNNKCSKNYQKIDFHHTSHFIPRYFVYFAHFKIFFGYTVHLSIR